MELKNKIVIYSDAIQTGKTTRVLAWVNDKQNVYGILTPDVANKRRLYNIADKQLLAFEAIDQTTEDTEEIGKFIFLRSAFEQAKNILKSALPQKADWLIIDEIGKLEMQNKGLEPDLSNILDDISEQSPQTKILMIIRDTLLEVAVQKYNLQKAEVVGYTYFLDK
jgi:nucleoside-triphosphatase THEP1